MASRLGKFTVKELATAIEFPLKRGRPSAELRASLQTEVQAAIDRGEVAVKKGQLVSV